MDLPALLTALQNAAPGSRIEDAPSIDGQPTVYVDPAAVIPALTALKNGPDPAFEVLVEFTAVDLWPREPRFELIYLLVSVKHRQRLRVKVRLPGHDPHVPTASGLWPAANWLEREVWDMFGIAFDGHPDPRRLLMPEVWEGFPLRKDYPVQIRMKPKTAEAMQISEEEFRANLQRDRLSRH